MRRVPTVGLVVSTVLLAGLAPAARASTADDILNASIRTAPAGDSGVEDPGGWGGITPAQNVRSPQEVDAVLDEAARAGARIARRGAPTFWGGYSGVFVDPDGHPWEVAHNPHWTLADDGSVSLERPTMPTSAFGIPPMCMALA